jgi:hypothetical protein
MLQEPLNSGVAVLDVPCMAVAKYKPAELKKLELSYHDARKV